MAWRIVKQPNGLLARFSDVVDHFTDVDMTIDEAIDVCAEKMGRQDAALKVQRGIDDPGRWADAIESIRVVHGDDAADRVLAGDWSEL